MASERQAFTSLISFLPFIYHTIYSSTYAAGEQLKGAILYLPYIPTCFNHNITHTFFHLNPRINSSLAVPEAEIMKYIHRLLSLESLLIGFSPKQATKPATPTSTKKQSLMILPKSNPKTSTPNPFSPSFSNTLAT